MTCHVLAQSTDKTDLDPEPFNYNGMASVVPHNTDVRIKVPSVIKILVTFMTLCMRNTSMS